MDKRKLREYGQFILNKPRFPKYSSDVQKKDTVHLVNFDNEDHITA